MSDSHEKPPRLHVDASVDADDLWVDAHGIEIRGGARDAFYRLSRIQKLTVLAAACTESAIWLLQRRTEFRQSTEIMARFSLPARLRRGLRRIAVSPARQDRDTASPDDSSDTPSSFARAVARLHLIAHEMTPIPFDCVTSSTALWWYLRNLGFEPTVHVGVRSFGGVFDAHAWVCLDGEILNDLRREYRDYREIPAPVVR